MKKKILIFNLILITVALCVVFVAGISVNRNSHYEEAEQQVVTLTKVYASAYKGSTAESGTNIGVPDDVRLTIIDVGGKVLFDSDKDNIGDSHLSRPEVAAAFGGNPQVEVRYSSTLGMDMIYYAETTETADGVVCVRVAIPVDTVEGYVAKTVPTLVWILLAALLVSYVASIFITGGLVRPIRDVKDMLVAVNNGDYAEIPTKYGDAEIDELVKQINVVSGTLQSNINSVRDAERTRSEFFANASHELKTPLTAVKGFNDVVAMTTDQDSVRQLSQKIDREAMRLTNLIDDMLALSRLEVSTDPVREQTDLAEVCRDVQSSLSQFASERNVTVTVSGEGSAIVGGEHARTIVKNLVENAIRYNKDGGNVRVEVAQSDDGEKTSVTVADTGIGISEEHQAHVFERFYRVNASRSRETGGTGLGLAIVKHIASLYGADIELKSHLGIGTTIKVTFAAK